MALMDLPLRARNKWRRLLISRFGRSDYRMTSDTPYISFTFDDFPRAAYLTGGRILEEHGLRGTYYVSMRLLGRKTETGRIVSSEELRDLVFAGHDVGCHTFDHLDGTVARPEEFERSIKANQLAYEKVVPGGDLKVFAYPLDGPSARVKRRLRHHFVCCRGGGQTYNQGTIDLALLKGYFLDSRNTHELPIVAETISKNVASRGWLIFATHDVSPSPTRYGCEPVFFEEVVRQSIKSGAKVLPVTKVCEELGLL